jgi:hypothetical protein
MNPLDLVPKSLLGIVIIALLTTNFSCAIKNGQLQLEVSRAATKLAQAKADHADAVIMAQKQLRDKDTEYRDKERILQASADNTRKDYATKLADANITADTLRVRLSSTPFGVTAPTDSKASPFAITGQTAGIRDATQLPESFGFADEALRAETIRLALLSCYKQYDDARDALEK